MMQRPDFREAAFACYSMLRGFLNAMDAESSDCSKRFICEVICSQFKHFGNQRTNLH